MADFSPVASDYQRRAVVQHSAGETLLELLAVAPHEDVLDLACGPGALTARIRELTRGRVAGCDSAAGMVTEAQRRHPGIEFAVCDAAALPFTNEFDAIFCNSAFQWFAEPAAALAGCLRALRPGGRMAMQAPAKAEFCPAFVRAVARLEKHPETREVFTRFRSPWLFLENAENYSRLFAEAGFKVAESRMETETGSHTPEKAMEIFRSGAALAYLNPQCYTGGTPPEYPQRAEEIIAEGLRGQTGEDGQVSLDFHRIYLLAYKP